MTFADMQTEVALIVQDESLSDSIPGYINEAFLQASGRINLPDLKRIDMITTIANQNYTSLVAANINFNGRLSKVLRPGETGYSNDTVDDPRRIRICRNLEHLLEEIQEHNHKIDDSGDVRRVALEGRTLWYHPIPTTPQNIFVVLYGNPSPLINDDDSPSMYFPEIVHRNIGIHGAAMLMFNIIEDGVEGDKVNTMVHKGFFDKGCQDLMEWVGKNRHHCITSRWTEGGDLEGQDFRTGKRFFYVE